MALKTKFLLGLGTIMTIATPIVAVVSCSSAQKLGDSGETNGAIDGKTPTTNSGETNGKNEGSKTPTTNSGSTDTTIHDYQSSSREEVLKAFPDFFDDRRNEDLDDQAAFIFGRFYKAWAGQHPLQKLPNGLVDFSVDMYSFEGYRLAPTSSAMPQAMQTKFLKKDGKYFYKFKLAYDLTKDGKTMTVGTFKDDDDKFIHAFWKYEDIPSYAPLTSETVSSLDENFADMFSKGDQKNVWDEWYTQLNKIIQPDGSFIVPISAFSNKHLADEASHISLEGNSRYRYVGRWSSYTLKDWREDMTSTKVLYLKYSETISSIYASWRTKE